MGYITTRSFATVLSTIHSSEQSAFPSTNVNLRTTPNRPWKCNTTLANTNYVGLDIGALGQSVIAVHVDNFNVDAIVIEGDDNAATTASIDYSSGTLEPGYDYFSRGARLRRKCTHILASAQAYRYWRVRPAPGASITDGESRFSVGSISVFTSYTEWDTNTGFPPGRELRWATIDNDDAIPGGRQPIEVGHPYSRITLPSSEMPLEAESTIAQVLAYGTHRPFLFYWNDDAIGTGAMVRRVGLVTMQRPSIVTTQLSPGLTLEEVV